MPLASQGQSVLLDLLEHLENALRRADEHALEGLGKATPLERVAAGTGTFGHACSLMVLARAGWRARSRAYPMQQVRKTNILQEVGSSAPAGAIQLRIAAGNSGKIVTS